MTASTEVSRSTPYTCQCWRIPERAKPISPISHVKVTASRISTYCECGAMVPQRMAPVERAPLNIGTSMTITTTMAASTAPTW